MPTPPPAVPPGLFPVNEAWLARRSEPILDPDLPIVDPHHHLWDRDTRYLLDDLLADTGSGHRITDTVFIQCRSMYRADGPEEMKPLGETEFVNGIAAMSASGQYGPTRICSGIVGHADLTLGARARPVLEALIRAGGGRFKGIRHSAALPPDDSFDTMPIKPPKGLMGMASFREGFALLAPLGLSFDAWLFHTQIAELTDLARAFPGTVIVLDHVGGPIGIGSFAGRRDEVFAQWKRDLADLAALPNVQVKLGGLAMQFCGFGFETHDLPPGSEQLAAAWKPYVETCIEGFGVDRCMFESNFPVDKRSCAYPILWNAFKRLAAGASAAERDALFRRTAQRVYRLPS